MSCWVNRGAKGIALIDTESERPKLKYVFDVSDVHKAKRVGRDPYIWELKENHKEAVLARLEQTYGSTDGKRVFEQRIIEIAERTAAEYYEELLPEIGYVSEGSLLEELDELNVGVCIRETLASSIAYTVLSRCGADMEKWKEELDFTYISEFSTPNTLAVIGNATAEMCKPFILEIGRTVVAQERQVAKGKNIGKDLAKESASYYNALKRESKTKEQLTPEMAENKETEELVYGTDIREERGLSDTQPDAERGTRGDVDQVRADAQELFEGTQGRDLSGDAPVGRTESTLSQDTGAGRTEDGLPDSADGTNRRRDGGTESSRSDEMGGKDEQHQALGGGNRIDGADLQPVSEETQQNRETEKPDNGEDSLSGSFFVNLDFAEKAMEIQKGILCSDRFLIHKRPEIAGYFQMEQDAGLQTEYLKNCFRMEEFTELDIGEIRAGYRADEDGLTIWKGHYPGREAETKISWEDARYWVNAYMEDGVYLLPGEKAEQIDTNGMYQQLDLFSLFTEQVGSIAMKQAEQGNAQTEQASPGQLKAALPKEQLDMILQSGGGRKDSRKRIYAKYRQGKTPEEMAAFLKKEYGTTGKGFEFDGKQVAVWFDGQGMCVGHGTSAQEQPVLQMDWQEIEAQIRSQVENGTYMGASEAYLVDEVERGRIATFTAYFFYDGIGEMPEELFEKIGNRSDAHERMVELLSSPEGIDLVASCMDKALAQLESGEKKLRFRSVMPGGELRAELDDLLLKKRTFPAADHVEVKKEDFITQDEIDYRLGRGSGVEHGSFRIYDYYMEGHGSKETAAFLKHEYGI